MLSFPGIKDILSKRGKCTGDNLARIRGKRDEELEIANISIKENGNVSLRLFESV